MKDLTALLMGDPAAAHRRAPTQAEMVRPNAVCGHEQVRQRGRKRTSDYYQWQVGESRNFDTFREAKNKVTGLYLKGMTGSIRSRKDGTYTVTRML